MSDPSRTPLRVLFLGNSYVFYNHLPHLVQALAGAAGVEMEVDSVTEGGRTLLGHLRDGRSMERLGAGGWDAVILQEQSTRPFLAPAAMHAAARDLHAKIAPSGARTVFYLTWARHGQPERQAALDAAYYTIAAELAAEVAPAGPAWRRAFAEHPEVALHVADGSHPSPPGSYLAACVLMATLTGLSPLGLPVSTVQAGDGGRSTSVELPAEEARFLQRIASEALAEAADRPPQPSPGGTTAVDLRLELLRETAVFQGVPSQQIEAFLAAVAPEPCSDGTTLFSAGDVDGTAYVALDGDLRVTTPDGAIGRPSPRRLAMASTFGIEALLGRPHSATVQVETPTTVLPVRAADLDALAAREPDLVEAIRRNVHGFA